MNLDGPDVSELSCDPQMLPISPDGTLPPLNSVFPSVPTRRRKKGNFVSNMASSTLRVERQRSFKLLEKIILAKQQALNDQRCKLDFLESKMCALKEDNRMLKAQSHVQAAIINRLDGKNAKLPMIMNSQMEEIRVYREQLKRLKDIFIRTNKAMQESENARYRAEEELQHLRNLAFEQNLPEREELVLALQQLREEFDLIEGDKMALEKYVQNLEKNQRCERTRLLRRQRELQASCSALASKVRCLQSNLQERQRMLEAYAQRARSRPAAQVTVERVVEPAKLQPSPHLPKMTAKANGNMKSANCTDGAGARARAMKKKIRSSTRPVTTFQGVERRFAKEVAQRPQTVSVALDLSKSDFSEQHHDSTLKMLKANENLARLVAEAKIREVAMHHPMSNEKEPRDNRLTVVAGTQFYDDWPEFEVVEPLKIQPFPRPVKVQNDIIVTGRTGAVAAQGDSMEMSELLRNLSDKAMPEGSKPMISNLLRDVVSARKEHDGHQGNNFDDHEKSIKCPTPIFEAVEDEQCSKSGLDGQIEGASAAQTNITEPHERDQKPTASVAAVDCNNTNSAVPIAVASGTCLASKLFDAQVDSRPSNTLTGSRKTKV